MKVLFSTHRYLNRHPGDQRPSPHEYCAIGAAEAQGIKVGRCWFDEGGDGQTLTVYVANAKPDLVVATPLVNFKDNVDPAAYGYIRDYLKVPVIGLWLESAPDVVRTADEYASQLTANVFVDSMEYWKQFTKFPEKTFWVPEPKDPRIFYYDDSPRDIPISFAGSLLGRIDRALNIAWLTGNGIDVRCSNGLETGAMTGVEGYAETLRRSVATLNFTSAVTFNHLNARTSEALMCGCLLLETHCAETAQLLEPFQHYVPFRPVFNLRSQQEIVFNDAGDLRDKLDYFMRTEAGRAEGKAIAERGRQRAMELFDGRYFWSEVFRLIGLCQ